METQFLTDLNNALLNGIPTSKSKKPELVPKIAVSLHLLECTYNAIMENNEDFIIPEAISLDTLKRAISYIDSIDEQKELFYNVSPSSL